MRLQGRLGAALAALVVPLFARTGRGDDPKRVETGKHAQADSSYGRIDGDLGVVLGAGATLAPRGPRATVDFRVRYLDTAGLFVTYEDGPIFASDSDPRRAIALGLELRPLFLARWLTGRELARDRLDLLIDSFGLELGASFAQPAGSAFASRPGVQAGLGVELPILARATGPWIGLHGGVRWSDGAISGDRIDGPNDRHAFLSITLAWHQIFATHVVDVGDRAPR